MYTITSDHTTLGMTQTLHTGEHLRCVMDSNDYSPDWRVKFYVAHYAHTRSMFHELKQYFLKNRIIDVRKELRVREQDFGNFQVEERMKVIKEICQYFRIFLYQEGNFNFSPFKRKLKFHIFSCLKFCFKIPKI